MSNWDPKDEWRKLRLMTEARYLMEVGADWDTGYSDDGVENKAEEEQKKKDKDQRLRDKKAKDQKEYDKLKKCETWGDLAEIIGVITHAKELKALEDKGGKAGEAAKTLLKLIPGTAAFMNWVEAGSAGLQKAQEIGNTVLDTMKGLQTKSDEDVEKAPGGILDAFKIDDGYQRITDNELEEKFFKDFSKYVHKNAKGQPKKELPDQDINTWFEEWLSENVGSTDETVKGAEEDTKFTDIAKVQVPKSEVRKSAERVGSVFKGMRSFFGLS